MSGKPTPAVKEAKELTVTEKKAIIIKALEKEGYAGTQLAVIMGITRQRVHQISKSKSVLAPLVKKAKKSLRMLAQGKIVGSMAEVKGSDVIGAAKIIMEHAEPVTQRIESRHVSMTVDMSAEERSKYQKLLGLDAIEAEFEEVPAQKLIEENKE